MLCFRDMTFCSAKCVNVLCRRYFGDAERQAAKRWWGGDDAPVAFHDFGGNCKDRMESLRKASS